MAVVLTLGPLLFTDFEVPDSIKNPVQQNLVVKRLVGGDKVIDAMGRDDRPISWSGRFRGSAAETRSRLAGFTCIQGQQMVLAWSSFRYLVVVSSFEPDFRQQQEIPYSITCEVIEDLTSPILTAALSVDAAISSDVNNALQAGAEIGVPGITSAVSAVAAATGDIGSFQGASATQLSGVQTAIQTALAAITGQTDMQNALVTASGSVAGALPGGTPQSIADSLSSQAAAFGQLGQLYQLQALLGRTSINVANAGT